MRPFLIVPLLVLVLMPHFVLAQGIYSVTGLGTLGGQPPWIGGAINESGQIVGSVQTSHGLHGFIWNLGGGLTGKCMHDLGPGLQGFTNVQILTHGLDLSNQVSGNECGFYNGQSVCRAFLWTPASGYQDLGSPLGYSDCQVGQISLGGVMPGACTPTQAPGSLVAFIWNGEWIQATTPCWGFSNESDLTTTNLGATYFGGEAAFPDQQGDCRDSHGGIGFFSSGTGEWTELNQLLSSSEPSGVNGVGEFVGSAFDHGSGRTHAILWHNNVPQDLGTLPGDQDAWADGINDAGKVVGKSCIGSTCRAFIWDSVHGMRNLNSLIPPNSGVQLREALAITNLGKMLVSGSGNGNTLFMVDPSGQKYAICH